MSFTISTKMVPPVCKLEREITSLERVLVLFQYGNMVCNTLAVGFWLSSLICAPVHARQHHRQLVL